MNEYKTTYALRFVVDIGDLMKSLPQEIREKCHILLPGDSYHAPVVDFVSDEPFEVFGEYSAATQKGTPLCHVRLPIETHGQDVIEAQLYADDHPTNNAGVCLRLSQLQQFGLKEGDRVTVNITRK